jgi:hypothetical protein
MNNRSADGGTDHSTAIFVRFLIKRDNGELLTMVGKIISNKYGLLIVGLIILGLGIFLMSETEVKCGDDVMREGTTCTTSRKGTSTTRTYDEQKTFNNITSYAIGGVGGVMTVSALVWIIRSVTRRPQRQPVQ